jgi:hypothetical protein
MTTSPDMKHLEALILQLSESFSREIGELRTVMRTGFDRLETTLRVTGRTEFR